MTENKVFWYYTAEVYKVQKITKKVLEQKTISRVIASKDKFFPLESELVNVSQIMIHRENFVKLGEEYCSVRLINQVEISKETFDALKEDTYSLGLIQGEVI
ncbi:MAG: hypothetical protein NT068_02535 [Candidatus Nomurabacteria bacterium]|nr:hypothetical protein [Candidatus Nomurabacteria bacterium]